MIKAGGNYDAVAVELCRSRFAALTDSQALARMDLFSVIRQGRVYMVVANLALAAYQQRLADQFDIEPGAEQRIAVRLAQERGLPVLLIDREIGLTLRRIAARLGWWRRATLFAGLLTALLAGEKVTADEMKRLKEGDLLETAFAEFAQDREDPFVPLIAEHDRYMAAKLRLESERLAGFYACWPWWGPATCPASSATSTPPRGTCRPACARLILVLVLSGLAWGFIQSPQLGWDLVLSWVLITGGLCALGTLIAGSHPLTIAAGFLAAPLTTLHSAIGAGMVTGAVELWLRAPRVGDFSRLRHDAATLGG